MERRMLFLFLLFVPGHLLVLLFVPGHLLASETQIQPYQGADLVPKNKENNESENYLVFSYPLQSDEVEKFGEFGSKYNTAYDNAKKNELGKKLLPYYGKNIEILSCKELEALWQDVQKNWNDNSKHFYGYSVGTKLSVCTNDLNQQKQSYAEELVDLKHRKDILEKYQKHRKFLEDAYQKTRKDGLGLYGPLMLGTGFGSFVSLFLAVDRYFNDKPSVYTIAAVALFAGSACFSGWRFVDCVDRGNEIKSSRDWVDQLIVNTRKFYLEQAQGKGPVALWKNGSIKTSNL